MSQEDCEEEQITLSRSTVGFACQVMEHVLNNHWMKEPVTEDYIRTAVMELREKLDWKKIEL